MGLIKVVYDEPDRTRAWGIEVNGGVITGVLWPHEGKWRWELFDQQSGTVAFDCGEAPVDARGQGPGAGGRHRAHRRDDLLMAGQSRRGPVWPVPEPTPRPTTTFYDMQSRQVLGGEPMHLTVCGACCAVVPSGDKAQARHLEWHRLLQEAIDAALPR